jgi:hypothetical protein
MSSLYQGTGILMYQNDLQIFLTKILSVGGRGVQEPAILAPQGPLTCLFLNAQLCRVERVPAPPPPPPHPYGEKM